MTAGGKDSNVDDPADPSKTANHKHDPNFLGYRHGFRCVQHAADVVRNTALIAGDFCQLIRDFRVLLNRAVVELGCKTCAFEGVNHDCLVAYPNLLVEAEGFDICRKTFPTIESGRHYAYYMRIAWQLESALS